MSVHSDGNAYKPLNWMTQAYASFGRSPACWISLTHQGRDADHHDRSLSHYDVAPRPRGSTRGCRGTGSRRTSRQGCSRGQPWRCPARGLSLVRAKAPTTPVLSTCFAGTRWRGGHAGRGGEVPRRIRRRRRAAGPADLRTALDLDGRLRPGAGHLGGPAGQAPGPHVGGSPAGSAARKRSTTTPSGSTPGLAHPLQQNRHVGAFKALPARACSGSRLTRPSRTFRPYGWDSRDRRPTVGDLARPRR